MKNDKYIKKREREKVKPDGCIEKKKKAIVYLYPAVSHPT
jgi:hypothetical protein